jgi:hypothetical protein
LRALRGVWVRYQALNVQSGGFNAPDDPYPNYALKPTAVADYVLTKCCRGGGLARR